MNILRTLLAAARLDDDVREGLQFTRRTIAAILGGVLALAACVMTAMLWLAVALYLWLTPEVGQAGAAALTGAAFALVAIVAILIAGGQFSSDPSIASKSERPRDLVTMLENGVREESERKPKPAWDMAAMLAVGVVSALSQERRRP